MKRFTATKHRRLQDLQGIGVAMERDFRKLGIKTVAQLAKRDGMKLYIRLNRLTGVRQDPCVLDTLNCAVAQAKNPNLPAPQRNWWWWSRKRLARAIPHPKPLPSGEKLKTKAQYLTEHP